MARRRRKGKGRRGKFSVPLLAMAPVYPAAARVLTEGTMADKPKLLVYELTGYNMFTGQWEKAKAASIATIAVVGFVGHKVANKVGINRALRKATGGWISL